MDARRWKRRAACAALGLTALSAWSLESRPCLGREESSANAPAALSLAQALRTTQETGTPTVVVVTSRAEEGSGKFWRTLSESQEIRSFGQAVQFAEMPAESYAAQVRRLGVKSYPMVIVYRRGAKGLETAGHQAGPMDTYFVLGWLSTLGLKPEAEKGPAPAVASANAPVSDPAVTRTRLQIASGQAHPSEQAYQPPPPPPQPPYQPPPQYYQTPHPQPVYQQPAMFAPAPQPVVVPTASAPVVFQPQATQIVVGPTPPPVISFVQQAPTPAFSFAAPAPAPSPAPAPQPNLFAAAPVPSPAPAPAPAPAPSAAPVFMMAAPAPAPAPAAAPTQVAFAPIAQAPAPGVMVLKSPGLINSLIGTLGEHLAQKKNPRIQMASAPALSPAPVPAPSPLGQAPVAFAQAPSQAPAYYAPSGPPMMYAAAPPNGAPGFAPQNQCFPPNQQQYQPPPLPQTMASPQGNPTPSAPHKHWPWSH